MKNSHNHPEHDHSDHTMEHDHAEHGHAPMVDVDQVTKGNHAGHENHTDHTGHETMFRDRFWVSLVLSIPVLLYSPVIQDWFDFTVPAFIGSQWISLFFSLIIFVFGGLPFIQMAIPEVRNRKPGMMTLITLAISVSLIYSLAALFLNLGEGFFWELVTLIDVMLLGHWIEMRSVRQASGALDELAKLMPDEAERINENGDIEKIHVSQLAKGEIVLVRPGASIAVDGRVVDGKSQVNESMITGESKPVKKTKGDQVITGALNGEGSLRIKVEATGNETALAGIMRLVKEAHQSKSKTQILADKAAGWLFYLAIAAAAITAGAWTVAEGFGLFALQRVVSVLVIACPHALGLAVPLVVSISTASGAKNGVLIRDRIALEEARSIDLVVFDKTGTLTKGEIGLVSIKTVKNWNEKDALALAAAIEGDSEHSLAKGIRAAAKERDLSLPKVSEFEAIKGHGVSGQSGGKQVYFGGPRLLKKLDLEPVQELLDFSEQSGKKAQTVVYLIVAHEAVAALSLADVIREESRQAISQLHDFGIKVSMLTGDSEDVAKAVADELGIDQYFAEVLPEHKDQKIIGLQKEGMRVAMVGDGINDAPALARADIGIAIGSGTDVAVESAGIILVNNNPLDVLKIFKLSRVTYTKMIQNLIWATGYNVIAIPLAAGALASFGILLSPAIGALFMSASTVIVAINANLLRQVKFN